MRPGRRKVLSFAAVFVPLLLALVLVYPWLQPLYRDALRGVADPVAATFSPPLRIEATDEGGWRILRERPDRSRAAVFSIPGKSLRQIHISVVLLPALLLATPVDWRTRLRLLGLGCLALVLAQLVLHLVFVRSWVAFQYSNPGNPLYRLLHVTHSTAGQVFPVMLWALLTWRYWLPGPDRAES